MQKTKRRLRARSLFVAVIAASMVSLVGAPSAFAAAPTITSFSPTCGQAGTAVIITGTAFQDAPSAVSSVTFNGTAATTFTVNSDTQITATVPAAATTGPIAVMDSEGTATSTASFVVATAAGPCITSFTPTTGNPGTVVTLTGAGFTGATAVTFGGVAATTFTATSNTELTATVPTAAVTGPIVVTTPAGSATSATNFTVTTTTTEHDRDVTLRLRGHLTAKGKVTSDLDDCAAGVNVKIQRRSGGWRTVGNVTTNDAGKYVADIRDRSGRYRALVPAESIGANDTCLQAKSPKVRHQD
jgi:hypothetical protein